MYLKRKYFVFVQLLIILLINISFTHSQNVVKIVPQFSDGDTASLYFNFDFFTKNSGWGVINYTDPQWLFHSKVYKTNDGGYTWNLQRDFTANDDNYLHTVLIDSTMYTLIGSYVVYRTTNNGVNWDTIVTSKKIDSTLVLLNYFDENNGIIIDNNVWSTVDGGYTWVKEDTNMSLRFVSDFVFADKKNGWAACRRYPSGMLDAGAIAKTTNGGLQWDVSSPTYMMMGIDCIDTNNVFTVGINVQFASYFCSTLDGGSKWNCSQIPMYGPFYDIGFYNLKVGWIIGKQGKLLETIDSGKTWSTSNLGNNINLSRIKVLRDEKVGYLQSNKNEFYRVDVITSVNDEFDMPRYLCLEQNYPNPFNPLTVIKISISKPSYIILKVYNILGKEMTTLLQEYKEIGNYEVKFDASLIAGGLSSGIYYYTVKTEKQTLTKKMILIR